jgi:hypothetical protein
MLLFVINNDPTMADKKERVEKECINVTVWFDFRWQGLVGQ